MVLKTIFDYGQVARGASYAVGKMVCAFPAQLASKIASPVESVFREVTKPSEIYDIAKMKRNNVLGAAEENYHVLQQSVDTDIYHVAKLKSEFVRSSLAENAKSKSRKSGKRQYSTMAEGISSRARTNRRAVSIFSSPSGLYGISSSGIFRSFSSHHVLHKEATMAPKDAIAQDQSSQKEVKQVVIGHKEEKPRMESSEVPSTRLGRIFHYGSLAASVSVGAASEGIKRFAGASSSSSSLFLTPKNVERIVSRLSRMRGAALKIGQMISFQDAQFLPKEIQEILLKVQNRAHYMPAGQLERVMTHELGNGWRGRYFASFEDVPIAAASIGQVHEAVTKNGHTQVVVKVQYPGVADSIDSDLNNILMLLTASQLLPKGLFLEKSIANARTELKWECDYIREAQNLVRFGELLRDDDVFRVPKVLHNMSGEHVLTMEQMKGVEIAKGNWDQDTRNWLATNIMRLCLMEIIKFRFMQTDPNWANFLYNEQDKRIELLDFGASIEYSKEFIDDYADLLRCAVARDREGAEFYSKKLGYLTGLESSSMTKAHVDSIMVLGEPFCKAYNTEEGYDFSSQTVSDRVRGKIGTILDERLSAPPEETYSLHRKFSGVFLLCARLKAQVKCAELFDEIFGEKRGGSGDN